MLVFSYNVHYPYSVFTPVSSYVKQLASDDIDETFASEKKKLADLKLQLGDAAPKSAAAVISPEENWDAMFPEVSLPGINMACEYDMIGL